jgi:hypothetical protein
MGILNRIMTGLFDLVCWPFLSLDPMWGLTVVSLLAGVLMLWIFGKVSDQEAVSLIRDKIRGNLIGIRLFGDDLGMLFRLQGTIFRQLLTYLRYAMVPMLIMLVPVLLILTQLNLRFDVRPLDPGDKTVVTVTLRDASPMDETVELAVPDGVTVETPGVRIESRREVAWRVRVDEPGDHRLTVRVGDDQVEKTLLAGSRWGAVSPLKTGAGFVDKLLYPGEAPIKKASRIEAVTVQYPPLSLSVLGFGVDWLLFFFIASIVFGFAFKGVLGVEI